MLNRIINNEGSGTGEWTLLSRIIWLKAIVLAAGAAWNTMSGAIVQFVTQRAHALKQVVVDINPVQDLHGYDSPWPAGGGKNLLEVTATSQTINDVEFTVNSDGTVLANGTASAEIVLNLNPTLALPAGTYTSSGATGGSGSTFYLQVKVDGLWKNVISPETYSPASGITGCIIVIKSGATLTNYTFYPQIVAGSSSVPFSPYSNICPISGWTGVSVWDTGHNVWDETWEIGDIDGNTGQNQPSSQRLRSQGYISVKPNTQYFICVDVSQTITWMLIYYYDAEKNFVSVYSPNKNTAFTTPNNAFYMRFSTPDGWHGETYTGGISINYPSTDTEYHAYVGNAYTIAFPGSAGTVYGGTLTVDQDGSGSVEVDGAVYTITGQETFSNFQASANTSRVYLESLQFSPPLMKPNNTTVCKIKCNRLKAFSPDYIYSNDEQGISENKNATSNGLWIRINNALLSETTLNGVLAFLTDNPISVYYELDTPITYQLTAQQVITALQGYNNVWADTGDITVTFRGTPIVEPDLQPLQALNLLLGGAYRNNQTPDDVSDEEALDILLGGENR